jgi:hypothetical protein
MPVFAERLRRYDEPPREHTVEEDLGGAGVDPRSAAEPRSSTIRRAAVDHRDKLAVSEPAT